MNKREAMGRSERRWAREAVKRERRLRKAARRAARRAAKRMDRGTEDA